ncbi:MAG: hypothetical protein HQ478_13090 [Chloroflexi bacterium]|nr:hypothetical protein [Chloroflexota bacterium]
MVDVPSVDSTLGDVLLPEVPIITASTLNPFVPLDHQLLLSHAIELQVSLFCILEVAIISRITEHARGDDEFVVFALSMTFG